MGFLIKKRQQLGQFIPPPPSATKKPPTPDWVPPVECANYFGGSVNEPIEFTDHDLRLIQSSLPRGADPARTKLFPALLREWARVYLPEHFSRIPLSVLARRRTRLKKVAQRAIALTEALDELEGLDRWELVNRLGMAEGLSLLEVYHDPNRNENKRRLDQWRSLTATIAGAVTEPTWKPNRGQPRNIVAQLVLQDLAALFEYVAGLNATRVVDRRTREESGPFLNFTRAVWPVVFRNGDDGLTSQLRKWADDGRKTSTVINRISQWHPEWGVMSAL